MYCKIGFILSVNYKNTLVHLILDTGATASLISMEACKRLNIPMQTTKHKAIQVDGEQLDVVGEIHIKLQRDSILLDFDALVIKKMSSDFLAGTGFHKDSDIYSRMADDKIVIKGKHYINSTPPIALAARINQTSIISEAPKENNSPVLVKANQTATYLPGEGFSVSIDPTEFDSSRNRAKEGSTRRICNKSPSRN